MFPTASSLRQPGSIRGRDRAGITLTEILIAIFIMGIGLVSLATLFPIGLLRLREAQRQSRSAYLVESAAADVAARGLFTKDSFAFADMLNVYYSAFQFPVWYPNANAPLIPNGYNPLIQDSAYYGPYIPYDFNNPAFTQGLTPLPGSEGLPFAYDPLWRFQTGVYPDPNNRVYPEARFASGIGQMHNEPDGTLPSAHGLQRLTNFNRPLLMPTASNVPVSSSRPRTSFGKRRAIPTGFTISTACRRLPW